MATVTSKYMIRVCFLLFGRLSVRLSVRVYSLRLVLVSARRWITFTCRQSPAISGLRMRRRNNQTTSTSLICDLWAPKPILYSVLTKCQRYLLRRYHFAICSSWTTTCAISDLSSCSGSDMVTCAPRPWLITAVCVDDDSDHVPGRLETDLTSDLLLIPAKATTVI